MAKVFNDYDLISIDYKDVERMLEQFDLKTPTWARTLMQAVNRVAIKKIKQESKSRGYSAHHQQVWGDSGYQKNATSYANKDFSGKITMKRNAFIIVLLKVVLTFHGKIRKAISTTNQNHL